nr:hypothetical protein [Tanacetum cinerariifolium]
SWKSSDDEEVGSHEEDKESDDDSNEGSDKDSDETDDDEDDDDDDEEEETAKDDKEDKETDKGSDEVRESEGESEEEEGSFDPILRTPKDSEKESDDEEEQESRLRDESIFTTTSSQIVSLEPPTPIMTPSTIATITTSGEAPIPPPTIPSIILENLPTFNSAFRFEERLRLLETSFSEYRQTNQFADAVSAVLKGLVKNQVKEQVSRILPRIEESVNAILEAEVLTRSSHLSRTSYTVAADLSEMELKKILIEKMEGNKREDDDQEGPSARPNRGSKRHKEGGEQASASTPSEKETKGAGGSTKGSQSRKQSASESAYAEEPVQTTCQMEETPLPHPEWFSQPRKPPLPDRAWNTTLPAAQGDAQSWISDLARQTDACSSFNELLDTPIDFSNFIIHLLNVDTLTPDLLAGPT